MARPRSRFGIFTSPKLMDGYTALLPAHRVSPQTASPLMRRNSSPRSRQHLMLGRGSRFGNARARRESAVQLGGRYFKERIDSTTGKKTMSMNDPAPQISLSDLLKKLSELGGSDLHVT